MARIAHISDLHFGRHVPAVVSALQAEIWRLRPDLVALSGDLTQRAKPTELADAGRMIASLPDPKLVVPGNHDLPGWRPFKRFIDPWRAWRTHLGLELEASVSGADFIAIGVKTARRWGPTLDWSRGRISRDQLARVRTLTSGVGRHVLRILVAHHPFLLGEVERHRGRVGRADEALAALGTAGIDLVLGGHLHLAYAGLAGRLVVSQAGTATSSRYKGQPNAFNLIDASHERIHIEARQWNGRAFASARSWTFHRGAQSWQPALGGGGPATEPIAVT